MDEARFPGLTPAQVAGAEPVRLLPHDQRWAGAFDEESRRIRARWTGRYVEIRHIGSTAVPGLLAKPVIDMLAGLATLDEVDAAIDELKQLGYVYWADAPAQAPDRKWLFLLCGASRTHHLHLVVHGSRAWCDRALFCELLKSDPALRADYARLKRRLASAYARRRDAYTAAKGPFIVRALSRAAACGSTRTVIA